jgi:two-component system sensor histidine kinase HydH
MGRWATDRREPVAFWSSRKSLLVEDVSTIDPVGTARVLPTNCAASQTPNPKSPSFQINWKINALALIACVLLGVMLFLLALFWRDAAERHLLVFGLVFAGAVAICCALLVVLALRVHQRQRHIEIERMYRSQMVQTEHLGTLGELATGLAHEIRNPLAGIAGVVEIISRDLPATSPARYMVKEVRREIARINHTVSDLLQTAHPCVPRLRKSDLNTTVEHAVMLGRQQAMGRSIEIALQKNPYLPEVEHDSDQIHHVLLNLLLNALQAIELKGKITVMLRAQGSMAVVEVTDNGRGMTAEDLPNIFRPFYIPNSENTGLGLSLARRIVEGHHGRIDVTSTVGSGTTFTVVLPMRHGVTSGAT